MGAAGLGKRISVTALIPRPDQSMVSVRLAGGVAGRPVKSDATNGVSVGVTNKLLATSAAHAGTGGADD